MSLSEFYENKAHIFYNIDIIKEEYNENRSYKTLPQFMKYFKKDVLKKENINELPSDIRDIIKETIYNLFKKKVNSNEITIQQLVQLVQLINKYNNEVLDKKGSNE